MAARSAIVTGAGSGTGRTIAIKLAADGYSVTANDLSLERAKAVAGSKSVAGGAATAVSGDVSLEVDVNGIAPPAPSAPPNSSQWRTRLDRQARRGAPNSFRWGGSGTPEDIADVAAFLAADNARHMTGQVLVVDGGLLVGRF